MPSAIADITPDWLKPENASVLDGTLKSIIRRLVNANPLPEKALIGGAPRPEWVPNLNPLSILRDPTSQLIGLMTTQVPGAKLGDLVREVAKRQRVPNPIKGYHGSPHDFGRVGGQGAADGGFDLSKIGTGEGAQAYGHGLYIAEAEPVAKGYRDKLKRDSAATSLTDRARNVLIDGKPITEQFDIDDYDAEALKGMDASSAVSFLRERAGRWSQLAADGSYKFQDYARKKASGYSAAIGRLSEGASISDIGSGRMYEVAIHADPQSFLDLDAPLSQQPNVREALKKVFGYDWPTEAPAATGKEVASVGQMKFGGPGTVENKLKEAGIPGFKYLDQGSRAAGEGSRNYVVTDDSLIEILRKYGLLPFAAGLGAAGRDRGDP